MIEAGEKEIQQEETEMAILQLKGGRSPEVDGLMNEFYKAFKDKLIPILKEIYDDIFRKEEVTQVMRMGLVKIIFKKRGDKAALNNFRPITVLNSDFKILAKILANRLKDFLPKIIETNQAYAVKGTDITDTINNVRDMISYMEAEKKSGYVISLDLEKAFDRVEHEFLFDILKKIGFGENFIKWIKVLYKGAMSKIKCNGLLTNAFKITGSI